jgi:hypothetical protein
MLVISPSLACHWLSLRDVATYLLTYQTSSIRGRCTAQFTTDLVPAGVAAGKFERLNNVRVLRCQLLGSDAHEHPTDYCIYNRPKPIIEVPMVQAPVKEDDLPEEDSPEESEEETED